MTLNQRIILGYAILMLHLFYWYLLGRRQVLKCLLEIHALCREEDPWFLLNDLYLTDYCVWIQKARYKIIQLLFFCLILKNGSAGGLGLVVRVLDVIQYPNHL